MIPVAGPEHQRHSKNSQRDMMKNHICLDADKLELHLLDQRYLPSSERDCICRSYSEAIDAIRSMAVRGAPAIGVTGAYACVLAAKELMGAENWQQRLTQALDEIANARPTAVNLPWAVGRMRMRARDAGKNPEQLLALWQEEAAAIQAEDIETCHKIGLHGAALIRDGDTVLTHCNAGALATAGYGTALGVIRAAVEQGKHVKVIADETRPLLQGSRLTAYELGLDGIPVMLACDNACALLLGKGYAQIAITGADRVAANGDTANKIGTLGVAIIARHFHVPFYIACPLSTIDRELEEGSRIPIEARPGKEVTHLGSQSIAPENTQAYNFAFDVTPAELINGIITEVGILRPPYDKSIASAFAEKTGKP